MSHCVRAIFTHLHKARRFGSGENVGSGRVIWALLQGSVAAKEFLTLGFSNHPVVQNVLNLHMQQNAVTKEKYTADMLSVNNTLKDLLTRVGKLQSKK